MGIEGEGRWLHWNGPGGQIESNYLGGGQLQSGSLWAPGWVGEVVSGRGVDHDPNYPAAGSLKGSYFAYAPGGTLQFRLTLESLSAAIMNIRYGRCSPALQPLTVTETWSSTTAVSRPTASVSE